MVSSKLKDIIYKKLYSELSHLEIIRYKEEIWFIDRDNKYWYFIYNDNGTMWWRYDFFFTFFEFFSITDDNEFSPILSSWVEEVLNCKVSTTWCRFFNILVAVEEVLNCKVSTTVRPLIRHHRLVEEVLNCKVTTTDWGGVVLLGKVEEVLNCKVTKTGMSESIKLGLVEEVLKL
jgi:hypothetical protein